MRQSGRVGLWLLSSASGYIAYLAIVVPRLVHTPAAHVSYIAPLVLTTVAWAIIALVVRSALEVVRPSDSGNPDVRDRDIARFAEHASRWCLVAGLTAGFCMASNHVNYFWIANVTYLGLVLWLMVGSVFRILAYRRGL